MKSSLNSVIQNARIESTMLGEEDHGIFTCMLSLDFGGSGVGFGGYGLDDWNESLNRRVGTAYGLDCLKLILKTLDVSTWEKLPGTYIRVELTGPNLGAKILRIGHVLKDKWFSFEDDNIYGRKELVKD